MGYRIKEKQPHKPNRSMQDTATPSKIYMQNGTTAYLAIPCWYQEVKKPIPAHHHDRMHHDHVGWPSPNHPDHICQNWDFAHSCCSFNENKKHCDRCHRYIDMSKLIPIHLTKEGYKSIVVAFDGAPNGLKATGHIDKKDWIVRIVFIAKCDKAIKDRIKVPYTVFAQGNIDGRDVSDVVSKGMLEILPGPYVS